MKTLTKVGKVIEWIIAANAGAALGFGVAAATSGAKVLWLLVGVMLIDLGLGIYGAVIIDNKIRDIKEKRYGA